MAEPVNQKTVMPSDEKIFLQCSECENSTRHQFLAKTEVHWQDDEAIVDLWETHLIIQCQGCMAISYLKETQFSEEWDIDPKTGEQYLPTKRYRYPEHIEGRDTLIETYLLPSKVQKIYEETQSSFNSKMNIMSGFGIRATIEAVCKDKGISGRNLKTKIDNLAKSGHITSEGATILHSLRFMGNKAAHEIKEHSIEELNAGIDVVEYLLKGVYVIPKLALKLPKKS